MTAPSSFSGSAQATTLASAITSIGQTSFTLAAAGTWLETIGSHVGSALGTSGNFVICVDYGLSNEERILCSSVTTSTGAVTAVTRGYDGTTASTHSVGATVVHTISTDVPYQANLGVTNAATASTAAAAAQSTANSALTAANTLKSNVWTTGSYTTGNPFTNITGITGYTNYMIMATCSYLNTGGAANNVSHAIQINGSGSYSAQNFILASSGATRGAATSVYAYTTTTSSTFSVSLNVSATQTYTPSNFLIQVIGYN
jgi:trimeric autotransporter adhesin